MASLRKKDILYDIGEKLFFMEDNKVKSEEVFQISIREGSIVYFYYKNASSSDVPPPEMGFQEDVFRTKNELLESL